MRPVANWAAVQRQLFGPGLEYLKYYFLIGCPIMIGIGVTLFFVKKYRKNK